MSNEHTPGPWIVKGRVNRSTEAVRIESHHPASEHHLYQVADVLDANGYPQNKANLALIAAAPDLLAVLQTIVRVADGRTISGNLILDENSPLMDAARDAIAKATTPLPGTAA